MTIERVERYIERNELKTKNRAPRLVAQRAYLCFYMRTKFKSMSLYDIRDVMGYSNHASVHYGMKTHRNMTETSDVDYMMYTSTLSTLLPMSDTILDEVVIVNLALILNTGDRMVLENYMEQTGSVDLHDTINGIVTDKITEIEKNIEI